MSRIKELQSGFWYLLRGFTFLVARPRLWTWVIIPTAINIVLMIFMIIAFFHWFGDLYGWLAGQLGIHQLAQATAWWQHALNGLLWVANLLFQIFIFLVSLLILLVVSYGLSLIIAGPFNSLLSERVEMAATGFEPPPFSLRLLLRDTWRTIKVQAVLAIILIVIPIAFFVLSFIPLIGGPLYVVVTFLVGAWNLGYCYAEIPLDRRGAFLRDRTAFARTHRWALVGLGAGYAIPFFGLLCTAPMVTGGTLYYIERVEPAKPEAAGYLSGD
jgi:CysZ protein